MYSIELSSNKFTSTCTHINQKEIAVLGDKLLAISVGRYWWNIKHIINVKLFYQFRRKIFRNANFCTTCKCNFKKLYNQLVYCTVQNVKFISKCFKLIWWLFFMFDSGLCINVKLPKKKGLVGFKYVMLTEVIKCFYTYVFFIHCCFDSYPNSYQYAQNHYC